MSLLGEARKAYEFFRAHDWVQRQLYRPKEDGERAGYCLEGVISYYLCPPDAETDPFDGDYVTGLWAMEATRYLRRLARRALAELYSLQLSEIESYDHVDWNDMQHRTREDVDALWQSMIRLAEEDERESPRAPDQR